jgi:aryl-alcohol dehydrogenase-like predicted oxidoreductase
MRTRRLGPFEVSAIGLGCMNLSHGYGAPPGIDDAARLLRRALDLGCNFFDTAALYGFGANETLIGSVLKWRRRDFVLASKCGIAGVDGKRTIDGRPETLKKTCDEALSRLKTDFIDLYYLHRWDKSVPIEDSVGALSELVKCGKIRTIGLCEVSAKTLDRAQRVHPISAVQSEYSLCTRNPEVAVLKWCRENGATFVAFSPLSRGLLAGAIRDPAVFADRDIRRAMPRFQDEVLSANLKLLSGFFALAQEAGCTMPQLALAWVLSQGNHVVAIPGTTKLAHLEENLSATAIELTPSILQRLDAQINARTVQGRRYSPGVQAEIDTEEVPA